MDVLSSINWVDICLVIALVGFLFVGIGMGFYRQLALTISLVIGFVLASQFSSALASSSFLEAVHAKYGQPATEAVAYGLIIAASLLVGLTVLLLFRRFFGRALRVADSFLGGVLGVGIGCLLFGFFALGIFQLQENKLQRTIQESLIASRLAQGARVAGGIFPEEIAQQIETRFLETARELVQEEEKAPSEPERSDPPDPGSSPR